jgi:hypothetical protein
MRPHAWQTWRRDRSSGLPSAMGEATELSEMQGYARAIA